MLRLLAIVTLALALTATGAAHAQDSQQALAREAYVLGSQLAKQGQWADALAAYERSHAIRPHATTQFNIGYVQRALGHLVAARASLKAALARQSMHPDEMDDALTAEAESYLVELERKIPRVTVRVDPAGSSIWVDSHPIAEDPSSTAYVVDDSRETGPPAPGTFVLLVDPGTHEIRIETRDGRSTSVRLTVEPASSVTVDLVVERAPPASPRDYGWPIALTALGGAGLVIGALTGLAALDKDSNLAETCPTPTTCDAQHQVDIDALSTYTTVSTVAFIAGGLIAAGGLTWIVVAATDGGGDTALVVGPGSAAIVGRF